MEFYYSDVCAESVDFSQVLTLEMIKEHLQEKADPFRDQYWCINEDFKHPSMHGKYFYFKGNFYQALIYVLRDFPEALKLWEMTNEYQEVIETKMRHLNMKAMHIRCAKEVLLEFTMNFFAEQVLEASKPIIVLS